MIAHFDSPNDPAAPPLGGSGELTSAAARAGALPVPSFGEIFLERMYSVFGMKPGGRARPSTAPPKPPEVGSIAECDEEESVCAPPEEKQNEKEKGVADKSGQGREESANSFTYGMLRGDSSEFGYSNPLNKDSHSFTAADSDSTRASADVALQHRVRSIPLVRIRWSESRQEQSAIDIRRSGANDVCDNSAFVFIKPHANVSSAVGSLVRDVLSRCKIRILCEGEISAETIDSERLIDQHYYAIGSKAVLLKPRQLDMPTDKFQSAFHVSWSSVLQQDLAYNALDACSHLGVDAAGLEKAWTAAKEAGKLVKLGGGFYCGLIDTVPGKGAIYVINGFYMAMRAKFVTPGSSIHYFSVEWRSSDLSFADFRNKVLGSTDPTFAPADSIRGLICAEWNRLGLATAPNTGDNGVHASASPFEAMVERMNWLKISVADDVFGRKLLGVGITAETLLLWGRDPLVNGRSIFDTLEELNSGECIAEALVVYSKNSSATPTSRQSVIAGGKGGMKGRPSFVGRHSSVVARIPRLSSVKRVMWVDDKSSDVVTQDHSEDCDNSAFVFIKPHANVSSAVGSLVRDVLSRCKIRILCEGEISAETIDSERLIDQHYYAIGSKAVLLKPRQLDMPTDKFQSAFHVSWSSVLQQDLAYNALDACSHLGVDAAGLEKAWTAAKEAGKLVKLGGGFYCGLIDTVPGKGAIYVINGFYMAMRAKFVTPGSSIHYFSVEWRSSDLSFADFRNKVLGSTDPTFAPADSIRGLICAEWNRLGLATAPNTGDNGVHASASPFEAMVERMNWLKISVADDVFGRKLLGVGISEAALQGATFNPQIGSHSVFDVLEELNSRDCLVRALTLSAQYYSVIVSENKKSMGGSAGCGVPCSEEKEVIAYSHGDIQTQRRMTRTESEIMTRKSQSKSIVDSITDTSDSPLPNVSAYIPQVLSEAIFCGHVASGVGSVATAIAAAELYGGVAARASELDSESQFALNYWGLPPPLHIEVLVETQPGAGICLVDHQQRSQVHPVIVADSIVGVIDHHALGSATIITDRPIVMDMRPWGSSATIISHTYIMCKKRPRKCIAGVLLSAILSDTLNLLDPATTEWDKTMAAVLAEIASVADIEALANSQAKAKSG